MWGPLLRRRDVRRRRERFETADGDFVDVDWLHAPAAARAPILLVLHGLEGSARSHYALGLLAAAAQRGWRAAILNFRSCSGEPNRLPRFYHSGDTADLDHVVRLITAREPGARVGAVGVSLGGNVLLKWLGEQREAAPAQVVGAVGISVPFDLEACARVLDRGVPRALYTSNFMRTLRRKVRAKATRYPGFVDVRAALRARTFAAYDRIVTAPLHGFADERDYWRRSSSGPFLAHIRRPVLLINALDDPFIPVASLPAAAALPPGIQTEFTAHGGHAGFLEGLAWRARSWAEARAVDFLEPLFTGGER
jgi:predicted alpha/beta-fold hydrolase